MLIGMRFSLWLTLFAATGACAQNYPTKPVRLVAATAPGGSVDIVARLVGQKLTEAWGQQFVIENRAGGAGNIGTEFVARAAPDGYTLQLGASAMFAVKAHLVKLPFDTVRDFAPIIHLANQYNVLTVHPSVPVRNVREFIAFARARPGKLTYGSSGIGSSHHLSTALFMMMTGVDMVHVAYKGGAPAMLDLIGGHIDVMIETTPSALPYVKSGKVKALGVTSMQRSGMLPNVPTISEAGLPGFEFRSWMALFAPAGTPKDIIGKLNAEVQKALGRDLRVRMEELGLEVAGGSPEDLETLMRTDSVKYAKLVKAANITAL